MIDGEWPLLIVVHVDVNVLGGRVRVQIGRSKKWREEIDVEVEEGFCGMNCAVVWLES